MIALRRMLTWPKRRWRGGGFGIHSPFAYAMVTEALCKEGAAGHEAELAALGCLDKHFAATMCRCIEHLKPRSIAIVADSGAAERTIGSVIREIDRSIAIVDNGKADMAIVDSPSGKPVIADEADTILISRVDKEPMRSLWHSLTSASERGMDFSDYRIGLLCRYAHLPRQSFKIVIK